MTMRVRIVGAGVAGLTAAYEFACAGCHVELVERREGPGLGCSFLAGGMISPWCEEEGAEPSVVAMGVESLRYWTEIVPVATTHGSLVLAPARDRAELDALRASDARARAYRRRGARRAGARSRRPLRRSAVFSA